MKGTILGLLGALLLAAPAVQAQYNFTTNNGAVTVTGYFGTDTALIIPATIDELPVTGIAAGAFLNLTDLNSVMIPGTVISIGNQAFEGCTSLMDATILNGVGSIGTNAFSSTGLATILIPASVTNIGLGAFADCGGLISITVDGQNLVYSSAAGVLFDKSQTTLMEYPAGLGGDYAIPVGVTSMIVQAFLDCSNLTRVTIPGTLTNIPDQAFQAAGMGSVIIGDGVASIGVQAFYECELLTSVTIPSSVTSIGAGAFDDCYLLPGITIPDSVTNIGDSAFANDTYLASVHLPYGIGSIGDQVFGNTGLTNVTMPASVTNIVENAFAGDLNLATVTISASVTSIGESAFDSTALESVTIPASVRNIGAWAFELCPNLTSVYFLGRPPSISSSAFLMDPDSLTFYYLPGATGWKSTLDGIPTMVWNPQIQTNNANFGVRGSQFGFDITGNNNLTVVVEAATGLANPVWLPLQTITMSNGLFHFSEPFQASSPSRFYRLSPP